MEEQYGPRIYCSYPGCLFETKRAGKLRDHLSNVHHRESIQPSSAMYLQCSSLIPFTVTTDLLIPSEFRIMTAELQGSTNYCEQLYTLDLAEYLSRFAN